MAIYLDANILWSWRTFDEVERLALLIVAHQTGQRIFIPEIAAREAQETYRRSLEEAVDRHDAAVAELKRKFGEDFNVAVEPVPWTPDAVATWRSRLELVAETVPTEASDAVEALNREIIGKPPTKARVGRKPGAGARDAAIWLTILHHHRASGEPGVFVTENKDDFAVDGQLKPELAAELEGFEHPLTLYLSLKGLIETLGVATDAPQLTLADLRSLGEPMLKSALEEPPEVSQAYWGRLEPGLRYRTRVQSAEPLRLRQVRRYERDDDAVLLVDADWRLQALACFQDLDADEPQVWTCLQGPIEVSGRVQMFIPDAGGGRSAAQLIGGTWSSPVSLFMQATGEVMSVTGLSPDERFGRTPESNGAD